MAAPAFAQEDEAIAQLVAESDNPAAAIAEARQQTASGDVTGAAATLERALLADPNAHDVRLLYAATLCRLGDQQGARIEIEKLDRQDISEAGWSEASEACGGALRHPIPAEGGNATGLSGEIYAGVAYDYNAAGALTLQVDFFGFGERKDGFALIGGGRLNYRSSDYAQGGGFYAGASIASKHDFNGPSQDYDIGELRAGYGTSSGATAWSVGPVVRNILLFNDPYLTEFGAQGDVLFGNGQSHGVRVRGEGVMQDYKHGVPGNAGDGMRYDVSVAYETRLSNKGFATIGLGGEIKDAELKIFDYVGGRLFGAVYRPFENHDYLSLSGTVRYLDFGGSGFNDRKDWRAYSRLAYGVALGDSGLFAEGALTYTYRKVKTDGFFDFKTYSSPGAELRFVWKF